MISQFDKLHTEVKAKNKLAYLDFIDESSQTFINKLTNPEYLNKDSLIAVGKENRLPLWCLYYFIAEGEEIYNDPNIEKFFIHLEKSTTPLFSNAHDYTLVKDKSRIRDTGNYIVVGRDDYGRREISWLPYVTEDENYKLNLIKLLQQDEAFLRKLALTSYQDTAKSKRPKMWLDNVVSKLYDRQIAVNQYEG